MSGHGVEVIDESRVLGAQVRPGVGQGPDEAGCVVVGQGPVQFADGCRGGVGKAGEGGDLACEPAQVGRVVTGPGLDGTV